MYSLLIVDDEPIEREAIRLLIAQNFPEITIAGEAEDGIEALSYAKAKRPDIVMIDINMPKMDGLECISRMSRCNIRAKYIIITSYSSFTFAQQAIRLGVNDFLVKPAEIETIRSTLRKVTDEIHRERSSRSAQKELEERFVALNPVLEADILRSLITHAPSTELPRLFSLISVTPDSCFAFVAKSSDRLEIDLHRITARVNQMGFVPLVHRKDPKSIVGVIVTERDCDDFVPSRIVRTIAKSLRDHLESPCFWGVGDQVDAVGELFHSYEQACVRVRCAMQRELEVCWETDRGPDHDTICSRLITFSRKMARFVLLQDKEGVLDSASRYFLEASRIDFRLLAQQTFHIVLFVKQEVAETVPGYGIGSEEFDSSAVASFPHDPQHLRQWMVQELLDLMLEIHLEKHVLQDSTYRKALSFIQANYAHSIELDDLASYLGFSASYVGKLLRKNGSKSFSELLVDCRLKQATRQLRETAMSVKEISYAVGFSSQHYFARIFKKHMGCSPSEYRNLRYSSER